MYMLTEFLYELYMLSLKYVFYFCIYIMLCQQWNKTVKSSNQHKLLYICFGSCSCLCPIHWRQVLSREWRCNWSMHIWVISKFIVYKGAAYIRGWWNIYMDIKSHSVGVSEATELLRQLWNMVMMTSSNGNIFRVTGLLCGEFTGPRWIPRTKASDAEIWCYLWSASERTLE